MRPCLNCVLNTYGCLMLLFIFTNVEETYSLKKTFKYLIFLDVSTLLYPGKSTRPPHLYVPLKSPLTHYCAFLHLSHPLHLALSQTPTQSLPYLPQPSFHIILQHRLDRHISQTSGLLSVFDVREDRQVSPLLK